MRRVNFDRDTGRIDADVAELPRDEGAQCRIVAAELTGVPRRMRRHRLRREPALEQPSELDHPKQKRHEDDDHQRGLERREAAILPERAPQWTPASCVTSDCSRETSPLFHADTPA